MSKKLKFDPSDFISTVSSEELIIEQLKQIPKDAKWLVAQPFEAYSLPIGEICKKAHNKIIAQKKEIDSLYYENSMLKNRHRLQKSEIEFLKQSLGVRSNGGLLTGGKWAESDYPCPVCKTSMAARCVCRKCGWKSIEYKPSLND